MTREKQADSLREAIARAYLADEDTAVEELLGRARMSPAEAAASQALAKRLVAEMREARHHRTGVDAFTQEYALSSDEGVVLMCLAEALLRVPDADTADRLIRDKLAGREWERHRGRSDSLFVNASTWALMLTGQVIDVDTSRWDFESIWRRAAARLGEPVIRQAGVQAVRMLGRHFVLGRDIEEALKEARPLAERGYRFSFDMLGEAAFTAPDAARYFENYRCAIAAIAAATPGGGPLFEWPGISIKLTALHPRFEYTKRERVLRELLPRLTQL